MSDPYALSENRDTVEPFWDSRTLEQCVATARDVEPEMFLDALREYLGATTGRIWSTVNELSALETFMRAALPSRSTVLICSFNAPIVDDAVIAAGHEVETFDLSSRRGAISWSELADKLTERHAAIIVPHLFGVPCDFRPLLRPAREHGILLIEDCSQTLGGTIEGQMAGTIGDAAVFSFNFDKPINLGGGGALLVNNEEVAERIDFRVSAESMAAEEALLHDLVHAMQTRRRWVSRANVVSRTMKRVWVACGMADAIPRARGGIGPLRAALGLWQLERYDEVVEQRNENCRRLMESLPAIGWHVADTVKPAWLKQKVLPENAFASNRIAVELHRRGLRVGRYNWPTTIDEQIGTTILPNAKFTAVYGLDVPIHQNMSAQQFDIISRHLRTA